MTFGSSEVPPLQIDYQYDSLSRILKEIYPAEYGTANQARRVVDYTYGTGGAVLGLKVDGAEQASKLEYNPAGQVISVDVGTPTAQQITDTYEYDPATLLLKNERVLRSGASMLTLDYAYSPARQLLSLLDTNAVADDRSYTYDGLGRIAFVSGGEVREPQWTQAYDYDIYGNRSSV